MPVVKERKSSITYEAAIGFAQNMNQRGLQYLRNRNINEETVARFHLGMTSNQAAITIPNIYHWNKKPVCNAIKYRRLPENVAGKEKYGSLPGSHSKGIFNFDALQTHEIFGIIANSIFDVMLIHQLGYPVIGPFAGEASWEPEWGKFIKWDYVINMGDRDPPDKLGKCPGEEYMLKRSLLLNTSVTENVINTLPPGEYTDISEAYEHGFDIRGWFSDTLEKGFKS